MTVEIAIPGSGASQRNYLTWVPAPATAVLKGGPATGTVGVTLRNAGGGGQLVFGLPGVATDQDTLALQLPANGNAVPFAVAGKFQAPSTTDGDAVVQAIATSDSSVLGSKAVMVRIRKKANAITAAERDRFLSALGILNNRGMGKFSDFRAMHVQGVLLEMHGNMGFLPWHRAYILDLERALQAIDPSVALPYWRFDVAAPNIFTADFMGVPTRSARCSSRPAIHWRAGRPTRLRASSAGPPSIPHRLLPACIRKRRPCCWAVPATSTRTSTTWKAIRTEGRTSPSAAAAAS